MPSKYFKTALNTSPLFILAALFISQAAPIQAQSEIPLVVAPARQQININPGTTETAAIKFFNQGSTSITGIVKTVDFIVQSDDGSPILLDNESDLSSRFSAASWITLPYDRATITAGEVLNIQFKINAPVNARPGGRYVAIYFEQTGNLPSQQDLNLQGVMGTSSRIVGLTYIRVNGPITESAIIKRFTAPTFIEYGPAAISAEILNRGDNHITPTGQITLYNWLGKKIDEKTFDKLNIFPDSARTYSASLGNTVMIGKYKAEVVTAYGESGQALTSTIYIWAFPYKIAIAITLGIIIIILLATFIWKYLKARQSKLEEHLTEEISEIEELKKKIQDQQKTSK